VTIRALLAIAVAGQVVAPGFRADWAVVLPADSVAAFSAKFYGWCSRPGPALSGYWRPDFEVIRDLEAALAPALELALSLCRQTQRSR
jgi:hypothetical protein